MHLSCALPHMYIVFQETDQPRHALKRVFQVYGCVVTARDMVEPKDPMKVFDKVS